MRHPYYCHQWQKEWCSDSSARRKQFNLFSAISEYISAGRNHGTETALTLYASAATPSMSAVVTDLNALIPYVHPGQLATTESHSPGSFTPGNEELYGGYPTRTESVPRPSIIVRLGDIVRAVPILQFPVGPDGHLRWFFRMPVEATQEPTESRVFQHDPMHYGGGPQDGHGMRRRHG